MGRLATQSGPHPPSWEDGLLGCGERTGGRCRASTLHGPGPSATSWVTCRASVPHAPPTLPVLSWATPQAPAGPQPLLLPPSDFRGGEGRQEGQEARPLEVTHPRLCPRGWVSHLDPLLKAVPRPHTGHRWGLASPVWGGSARPRVAELPFVQTPEISRARTPLTGPWGGRGPKCWWNPS